jgi:hypothetical protein
VRDNRIPVMTSYWKGGGARCREEGAVDEHPDVMVKAAKSRGLVEKNPVRALRMPDDWEKRVVIVGKAPRKRETHGVEGWN